MADVAANCRKVLENIREIATRCGRDPARVRLLAATKARTADEVLTAIGAGIDLIGENYVQEARAKRAAVSVAVEWHMIGHLQRNKVKTALDLFDVIESLDSVELAGALDREANRRGLVARAFVEVNIGGEKNKSGVAIDGVERLVKEVGGLSHLRLDGLMAVPPYREDPEESRPYFQALRRLQAELRQLRVGSAPLGELSMGMTHDYAVAIEEGATIVRVGTALFGPRGGVGL
jgi:hypothetical protein